MDVKIPLVRFLSPGDEQRFFDALTAIPAIKNHTGKGPDFTLKIDRRRLSTAMLRELLALLVRYGADLSALCPLAREKKFWWLNEPGNYWHKPLLPPPAAPASVYQYAPYIFDDLS
ncbi:hypothetical protein [Achromobacter sp. UMC71]|uniref:hypothetical protein n=1 Tax=Achromobacter sp. UMC71 TaxID=1862320 RepID=UPI00160131F2|nr:hypothetical protein [Achromobacter sp. UMC71]MBB1626447.1 hypothetical protein [Achromobacter sp. UMC71]